MKIENFSRVQGLVDKRRELLGQVDLLHKGQGLSVPIQSHYQSDELVNAARPAVLNFLLDEVANIDQDLQALGVTI